MGNNPVFFCNACQKFFRAKLPIRGNGATLSIRGTGKLRTNCPTCHAMGSSPGGELSINGSDVVRHTSTLEPEQIEEFKQKLLEAWRNGETIDQIREIVAGYAPSLSSFVDTLLVKPNAQTGWIIVVLVALLTFISSSKCDLSVDVDMNANHLIDQFVKISNQDRLDTMSDHVDELAGERLSEVDSVLRDETSGGSTAGRNDPCTCGSGKKYKKCCLKHH